MNLWGNIKKPEVLVKRFDNKLFWDYMEFLSNSEGTFPNISLYIIIHCNNHQFVYSQILNHF